MSNGKPGPWATTRYTMQHYDLLRSPVQRPKSTMKKIKKSRQPEAVLYRRRRAGDDRQAQRTPPPGFKNLFIVRGASDPLSAIKLKRTDTTLDLGDCQRQRLGCRMRMSTCLSQKAKRAGKKRKKSGVERDGFRTNTSPLPQIT